MTMTSQNFQFFADFLYKNSGLSLQQDKQYLLENRLNNLMRKKDISSYDILASELRKSPTGPMAMDVIDVMSVTETSFFRDKNPFDKFTNKILPEILKDRPASQPLRLWSAASSSGQEAYTLAILCRENQALLGGRRVEIKATDISPTILAKAKAGIYSQFEVQRGMPVQLLMKYFEQRDEVWAVKPEIKSMVDFQQFNLLSPFSGMPKFDVIFCRNVLIYFDVKTKGGILDRMKTIIQPDGYLVLGGAETTLGISNHFKAEASDRGLFRPVSEADASSAPRPARLSA